MLTQHTTRRRWISPRLGAAFPQQLTDDARARPPCLRRRQYVCTTLRDDAPADNRDDDVAARIASYIFKIVSLQYIVDRGECRTHTHTFYLYITLKVAVHRI